MLRSLKDESCESLQEDQFIWGDMQSIWNSKDYLFFHPKNSDWFKLRAWKVLKDTFKLILIRFVVKAQFFVKCIQIPSNMVGF